MPTNDETPHIGNPHSRPAGLACAPASARRDEDVAGLLIPSWRQRMSLLVINNLYASDQLNRFDSTNGGYLHINTELY
jgi:hypothetical protein